MKEELLNKILEEIVGLRTEFKQEITGLRTEVKQEITGLRREFKQEIAGVKDEVVEVKAKVTKLEVELKEVKELAECTKEICEVIMRVYEREQKIQDERIAKSESKLTLLHPLK